MQNRSHAMDNESGGEGGRRAAALERKDGERGGERRNGAVAIREWVREWVQERRRFERKVKSRFFTKQREMASR
jgi:hypothetical protein